MSETIATLRSPTGFSDPSHHERKVTVLGYAYGKHRDAGGYGRTGECMLAIVAAAGQRLDAVPVGWLTLEDK